MATRNDAKTPGQTFALVFGVVYVLAGVVGLFAADGLIGGSEDDKAILFPVNHLHNIVHFAVGGLFLWGARTATAAKQANMVIGVTYLLVAILGFLGLEFMSDLLNINGSGSADNFLHLGTAALALYFATAGAADNRTAGTV